MRPRAFALLIATCVIAGCSGGAVDGTAMMMPFDPQESFGAFAHSEQHRDQAPDNLTIELYVTDLRKIGSWPGTDVYVAFNAPGTICLIADYSPPWSRTGGSACALGVEAASKGIGILNQANPEQAQAVILVPDSATATINRGTIVAAGDGVIGVGTTNPQEGIAITLNFADGHRSDLDLNVPG